MARIGSRSRCWCSDPRGGMAMYTHSVPGVDDRRGARHGALEVDAPAGRVAARRGVAAPLAGGPVDGAEAVHLPDAADRARSLQSPPRRLHHRVDGRRDRVRHLRARRAEACRVAPSDRHARCCAHRVAGCGGRGALGDAEHGVGAFTGVCREAVSSSATPRSRLDRTPHAFCISPLAHSTARARWRRTDPGAS